MRNEYICFSRNVITTFKHKRNIKMKEEAEEEKRKSSDKFSSMGKTDVGWVITANDQLREYWSSNALQRTVYQRKVYQNTFPTELNPLVVCIGSTFTTNENAL